MRTPDQGATASWNGTNAPPVIPDHDLIRRIGGGSYGDVWLAINAMKKWTAVKVVYRRADDSGHSFEQEFRGLHRYDDLSGTDANLMPIKNVGENKQAGYFYYSMELADDAASRAPLPRPRMESTARADLIEIAAGYKPWTLSEELKQRGRLPPQHCIEHAITLAMALEQLHAAGLVHRDIKPSNIIFVNGRPKLADVGLVAATDATFMSLAGTSGFVPLYGAGEVSGDVFALGKVIFLMATGRPVGEFPKDAPNIDRLGDQERRELAELQAVYDRACAPSPEDRQPSARMLRDELELLRRNESVVRLRQLEEERKLLEIQRERNRRRRRRTIAAALSLAGVVAIVVAGILVYTWRLRLAHEATVAALEVSQLSRMLVRTAGWSRVDWDRIKLAARASLDDAVKRQAASTMSGLDVELLSEWAKVEATSAAFSSDGRILLSGYGNANASLITDGTNRTELPVTGEGKVCWADDGEPLILLAVTGACVLRDARTGRARQSFRLLAGEAIKNVAGPVMAVSADGTLVAAGTEGSGGDRIALWATKDGRLIGEHPSSATALAFTPDGTLLGVGGSNGTIQVFQVSPFRQEATLPAAAGPNPILGLTFGEDRKVPLNPPPSGKRWLMAAADLGTGIVIWDVAARIPRAFCRGSDYSVQSVAFHPDGLTLVSGGRLGVHFWDVMTGGGLLFLPYPGSSTRGLAFDREGSRLVVGANSRDHFAGIYLIRVEPHRGVLRLRGLTAPVRKVWISPDSRLVGALSDEWLVGVWETKGGALNHLLEVPAGTYADNAGHAFDASGERLAFVAGTQARLIDLKSGRALETWRLAPGFGDQAQFDAEGRLHLARLEPSPMQRDHFLWNHFELPIGAAPVLRRRQENTNAHTISIALTAGAATLTTISHDPTSDFNAVRCVDLHDGREMWTRNGKQKSTWDLIRLDPTGRWCAYVIEDGRARAILASLSDGQKRAILPDGCQAISPTGHEYAVSHGGTSLALHNLDDPRDHLILSFDGNVSGDTVTFSPNGRFLAWGCPDGTVVVADIETVRRRVAELGHARVGRSPE